MAEQGGNGAPDGALVEVENLRVWFPIRSGIVLDRHIGDIKAVDDVSFSISRGAMPSCTSSREPAQQT